MRGSESIPIFSAYWWLSGRRHLPFSPFLLFFCATFFLFLVFYFSTLVIAFERMGQIANSHSPHPFWAQWRSTVGKLKRREDASPLFLQTRSHLCFPLQLTGVEALWCDSQLHLFLWSFSYSPSSCVSDW